MTNSLKQLPGDVNDKLVDLIAASPSARIQIKQELLDSDVSNLELVENDVDGTDSVLINGALESLDSDFIAETFDTDEGCSGDAVFDLFINGNGVIEAAYNADESSACGHEEVSVPGIELRHKISLNDPVLMTLRENLATERQTFGTAPSL